MSLSPDLQDELRRAADEVIVTLQTMALNMPEWRETLERAIVLIDEREYWRGRVETLLAAWGASFRA